MSISLMAMVWPLKIQSTPKFVLLALADNANDAGYCWPSISSICVRTSLGKTAVINAIRWLEDRGFLYANRDNGRKTTYTLTVPQGIERLAAAEAKTGARDEPVRETSRSATNTGFRDEAVRLVNGSGKRTGPPREPTGTPGGPVPVHEADTNHQITINEPSVEREGAQAPPARGRRIPDRFPTEEELDWCRQEREDLDPQQVAAKFRDYWVGVPGAKGRKLDWPATWRNFVRGERQGRPGGGGQAPPARQGAIERREKFIAELTGRPQHQEIIDVVATERPGTSTVADGVD